MALLADALTCEHLPASPNSATLYFRMLLQRHCLTLLLVSAIVAMALHTHAQPSSSSSSTGTDDGGRSSSSAGDGSATGSSTGLASTSTSTAGVSTLSSSTGSTIPAADILTVQLSFNLVHCTTGCFNVNHTVPSDFAAQVAIDLETALGVLPARVRIDSYGNTTQVVNGASIGTSMQVSFLPPVNATDPDEPDAVAILADIQTQFNARGGSLFLGVYTRYLNPSYLIVVSTGTINYVSSSSTGDDSAADVLSVNPASLVIAVCGVALILAS